MLSPLDNNLCKEISWTIVNQLDFNTMRKITIGIMVLEWSMVIYFVGNQYEYCSVIDFIYRMHFAMFAFEMNRVVNKSLLSGFFVLHIKRLRRYEFGLIWFEKEFILKSRH